MRSSSSLSPHVVTADELASLVRCKRWHVRRYLQDVKPPIAADNRRTRLYDVVDVCLVQLAKRLEDAGCSAWVVRAVLANHLDELRRAFVGDRALVFAVYGVRGKLIAASDSSTLPDGAVAISLREIRLGLPEAIARLRRDEPTIHQFNRKILVSVARREASNEPATW